MDLRTILAADELAPGALRGARVLIRVENPATAGGGRRGCRHWPEPGDTAPAEPVLIEKHGRPVVVVVAIEEYERLKSIEPAKDAGGK
jgi:hypothetical protein